MILQEVVRLFGPKATVSIVVLVLLIAPVAIWHHVHVIICVVRVLCQNDQRSSKESKEVRGKQ
jgi:hypothetical protein